MASQTFPRVTMILLSLYMYTFYNIHQYLIVLLNSCLSSLKKTPLLLFFPLLYFCACILIFLICYFVTSKWPIESSGSIEFKGNVIDKLVLRVQFPFPIDHEKCYISSRTNISINYHYYQHNFIVSVDLNIVFISMDAQSLLLQ